MAEIVNSLFGVTPESLQMQRQALLDKQAMDYASLADPYQQANYAIYRGVGGLTQGIGGLLGAQDPEMAKAAALQGIAKQFDLTSIEGINKAIQALSSAGYQREAFALSQEAQKFRKTEADIAKAKLPQPGQVSTQNRQIISNAEVKLAKGEPLTAEEAANVRWVAGQETKPKAFRDADSGELITIQPLDLQAAAPNIAKFLQGGATPTAALPTGTPTDIGQTTSPAPGVTVTKVGEGKGLDSNLVSKVADVDEALTKLGKSVTSLQAVGTKIDNLDLGLIQNYSRGGASWLGINTQDRLSFDSLRREAKAEANNLLLLARGTQTEGDAQRAADQIADENTWKNKDALKAAFADLKKTHQNTIDALNAKRTTLTSKGKSPSPTTGGASGYSQAQEALIQRWMAANKKSREEVISYLKNQGKL